MDEVIRWSMDRVFDRDSVDLIFSILGNSLGMSSRVVQEGTMVHDDRLVVIEHTQVPGRVGLSSSRTIMLITRSRHYNFLCKPQLKFISKALPSQTPCQSFLDTTKSKVSPDATQWKTTKSKKRPRDSLLHGSPKAAASASTHNRYTVLESLRSSHLCQ